MSSKDNALEGTVREEYETAKATLEELAGKELGLGFNYNRLADALEAVGFEIVNECIYVRWKDLTDLLTPYTFCGREMQYEFDLYQITTEAEAVDGAEVMRK